MLIVLARTEQPRTDTFGGVTLEHQRRRLIGDPKTVNQGVEK